MNPTHPAAMVAALLVAWGISPGLAATEPWACYIAALPDGDSVPADALCVFDLPGIVEPRTMDGVTVERAGVQIKLRATDYSIGFNQMLAISAKLDGALRLGLNAGGLYFLLNSIRRGTVLPWGLEQGTKRRWLFSLNADFIFSQYVAAEGGDEYTHAFALAQSTLALTLP